MRLFVPVYVKSIEMHRKKPEKQVITPNMNILYVSILCGVKNVLQSLVNR